MSLAEPIRVIIIEDHEATLKGLHGELSREPEIDIVATATTSKAGMDLVKALNPDVVLLDLHLPDSEGPRSVTENFCNNTEARIIVFSADNRTAILNMVLGAGVAGYLLKSEPVANVIAAIKRAVESTPIVSAELEAARSAGSKLTPAEQHLLKMLARGMKYQDIAAIRVTAPETVRKQVDTLVDKLSLESREELIAWAVENGYGKLELHS